MLKTILCAMAALALMTAVPVASADDLAGVSGECYDDEGNGGQAYVAVTEDGEVEEGGLADTEGGAVDAVVTFAQGLPGSVGNDEQDACTADTNEEDPDREGKDYLEAHALDNQVCYDGDFNVADDPDQWACDTRPSGLPQ